MFGKVQRGVSKKPKPSKSKLFPSWLGTVVIILIVLFGAVTFALWKPWAPVQHPQVSQNTMSKDTETNHDYRFYDQLPKQQVTPIPEQAVPTGQTTTNSLIVEAPQPASDVVNAGITGNDTAPVSYILQVKSFQDPDSADARRSEILMNKLPADVITSTEGGQTWYRVISGPYQTQQEAILAQQTLQNSGIDSIVVKN